MWNDWAAKAKEKAKEMAANVDRQLNESVGMDENGKRIEADTSASASASASAAPASTPISSSSTVAATITETKALTNTAAASASATNTGIANTFSGAVLNKISVDDGDDDAWNDDFGFDDDVEDVDVDNTTSDDVVATAAASEKTPLPTATATATAATPIIPEKKEKKMKTTEPSAPSPPVAPVVPAATTTATSNVPPTKATASSPVIQSQNKPSATKATSPPTVEVMDSVESKEEEEESSSATATATTTLSTTTTTTTPTQSSEPPSKKIATDADADAATTASPSNTASSSISTPKRSVGGLFSLAQKVTTGAAATGGIGMSSFLTTTMTAASKLGGTGIGGADNTDDNDGDDNINEKSSDAKDENIEKIDAKDSVAASGIDDVPSINHDQDNNDNDNDNVVDEIEDTSAKGVKSDNISPSNPVTTTTTTTTSTNNNNVAGNAIATTPKKGRVGGLFSNLSNLAHTADSLLTAVVNSGGDEDDNDNNDVAAAVVGGDGDDDDDDDIDSNPIGSGGWEEENDDDNGLLDDNVDDVQDDSGHIKDIDPQEKSSLASLIAAAVTSKGKEKEAEEEELSSSSSSFVKLSPSSSISTPEVLPQQQDQDQQQEASSSQQQEEKVPSKESLDKTNSSTSETTTTAAAPLTNAVAPVVTNIEDDPRFKQLQETLKLREDQLVDKGGQLNDLQSLLESRDQQYKKKLQDTKEEAKKRIMRAKERCEAVEAKLQARSSGQSEDANKKQLIINELMEEGQALARKQSAMEQSVRAARVETRALTEEVRQEAYGKEQALEKIVKLEAECKSVKEYLASARQGESQAGKLETDLLAARADAEEKANMILSLQQRLKESTAGSKELQHEITSTRKSAAHEAQQEQTSMRREHNDLLGDLELKLRTTEREAGVREDALRHEVSEIRKRWQDAVRRADALSMDIQSSTAPLLRQLESMDRQSRSRTANAAELESRLRSELEEATIENETLGKDCSEFKSKLSRLERSIKERDEEIAVANKTMDEQMTNIAKLTRQEAKLKTEAEKRQIEYERVERLANEGVARVRSEMTHTVVDSEERYRGQIDKMESELKVEREKRSQLEDQVGQLLENTGGVFASSNVPQYTGGIRRESTPKKLHKAEGQAEILAGALGLGDDSDDNDTDDDDDDDDVFDITDMDDYDSANPSKQQQKKREGFNSFAALEQLSSKLRTAEVELGSMRKSLKESTETRQSLAEELGQARHAKEKLPLFELKVKELSQENREMEREIAGLQGDICDVRELYRTQLNVLLEEKTSSSAISSSSNNNAEASPPPANNDDNPETAS